MISLETFQSDQSLLCTQKVVKVNTDSNDLNMSYIDIYAYVSGKLRHGGEHTFI